MRTSQLIEIYPDTSAFSYLVRRDGWSADRLAQARQALVEAVRSDRIRVIGSQRHLEELARITYREPDFYRQVIEYFWRVVGPFLLLPTNELVKGEVKAAGPLSGNDRFEAWLDCQSFKKVTRDLDIAKRVGDSAYEAVTKFKEEHEGRRRIALDALAEDYPSNSPADVTRAWWTRAEVQIADWTNDYFTGSKTLLDLPDDRSEWPNPRDIPTAWNMHAFWMAKIVLNVGLGQRIGPGDAFDNHHYASAAYADRMITDDAALTRTRDLIPDSPVHIITFEQLLVEMLHV